MVTALIDPTSWTISTLPPPFQMRFPHRTPLFLKLPISELRPTYLAVTNKRPAPRDAVDAVDVAVKTYLEASGVLDWIKQNCRHAVDWHYHPRVVTMYDDFVIQFEFVSETEAVHFKLRFG